MATGTRDNLNQLLEDLNTQGHKYILMIFNEEKGKDCDEIDLYSSFSNDNLRKINKVLQTVEAQDKELKKTKKKKNNE